MPLAGREAFRKALLPAWVRAFAWLFLVTGSATPAMLAVGLVYPGAMQFSLFGWEHGGSPYDAYSLLVVAYFAASGVAAYGMLWGRPWGWAAAFVVGSVGLLLALGSMFVQPLVRGTEGGGYTIYFRLEPLLQIPFLYVLLRLRRSWASPAVAGDGARVRSNAPKVIGALAAATSVVAFGGLALVSSLTSGMLEVAGAFFDAVKANDVAKARTYLSAEAQEATDENALRQFLVTSRAFGFKGANWPGRRVVGQRGELKGSITSAQGEVPMVLTFVKEDGRWKIQHLARPAAATPTPQDLQALRARAEAGDADAQSELAEDYLAGTGVDKDGAEAAKWLRRAAERGVVRAQYNLGVIYDDGLGVQQDKAQALAWYLKAAGQGHARAQHNLGYKYAHGDGVARDYAQAIAWYRKAADQGFARSQFQLGALYADGSGVPRDDAQAAVWFRKAADQGLAEAQFQIGEACSQGRGMAQDDEAAVGWYRRAADQGLAKAQDRLAETYGLGKGVARSAKEAYYWRLLAARNDAAKRDRLGEARAALSEDEIAEVEGRAAKWQPASGRTPN